MTNSLKLHFKTKCTKLEETVRSLTSRVEAVESDNKSLKSKNKDLQSQISDLHKKLNKSTAGAAKQGKTVASQTAHPPLLNSPPPPPAQPLSPHAHSSHSLSSPANRSPQSPTDNPSEASSTRDPRTELSDARVQTGKTHVLLGDSVYRFIRPDLVFPYNQGQKISVSGITVDDLLHWLRYIPVNKEVQQIVVHVGVNTCLTDVVTGSRWLELKKWLRKVFPNARLAFSSILPPLRKSDSLCKTVVESNMHLAEMCESEGVDLIDNTCTFRTAKDLPKKALYHDNLHPSTPHGLAKLTMNIQAAIPSPHTTDRNDRSGQPSGLHNNNSPVRPSYAQAVHDSRPKRGNPLLPTPTSVPLGSTDSPGRSAGPPRDRSAWSSHPNQVNPPNPRDHLLPGNHSAWSSRPTQVNPPYLRDHLLPGNHSTWSSRPNQVNRLQPSPQRGSSNPRDRLQSARNQPDWPISAGYPIAQSPPRRDYYPTPPHPSFNGPALLPMLMSLLRAQALC